MAFGLVDPSILLHKLTGLNLSDRTISWIISCLTGCTQIVKCERVLSSTAEINTSIAQGSEVGPTFYIVMESDLSTLSHTNLLVKYADDTNLLVP